MRDALAATLDDQLDGAGLGAVEPARMLRDLVESVALLDALSAAHEGADAPMPFGGPQGAFAAVWNDLQEAGMPTDVADLVAKRVVDLLYPTVGRPAEG